MFKAAMTLLAACACLPLTATVVIFNGATPADNAQMESDWLAAIGIVQEQIEYYVDFESGFTDGQNVSNMPGLLPGGLVITNSNNSAIVWDGSFGGSTANGVFALRSNEQPYLTLDFSAMPVDYFAVSDIDQAGTNVRITFTNQAVFTTNIETTGGGGQSGEFFGVFRNDMPRIEKVEFDASGDGTWGIDDIRYGAVPEPQTYVLMGLGLAMVAVFLWRRR